MALRELGMGYAGVAYVTATLTVWDADPRIADEKPRLAEIVIQGRNFTCMCLAIDAFAAELPAATSMLDVPTSPRA